MKQATSWMAAVQIVVASVALCGESTLSFGRFGTTHLYGPEKTPKAVVLFVSGDGGWNLGVVDMARELASLDALVVGIDITHYLAQLATGQETCSYPAADFEALSQYVQKKLNLPTYSTPLLVGYSSGATLVYAVLVQAPPNTFAGAISLGFCPDLPIVKPFCRGRGLEWVAGPKGKGVNFLPAKSLAEPWVALQGTIDQVCDPPGTESFVAATAHGEIVVLPKVGHGYSVPKNWLPQFRDVFRRLTTATSTVSPPPPASSPGPAASDPTIENVAGLPLVEIPVTAPGDLLAVVVSGDGGWAGIDREVAGALVTKGVAVVGLDSLRYFWHRRTPEESATDLGRIARHYLAAWQRSRLLLVGYSRGADVLPFMINRLPAELRAKIAAVALLGPGHRVEFEFHVGDWLGGGEDRGLPTTPEARHLVETSVPLLCFFGEDETDSLCRDLAPPVIVNQLPGGHHFGGRYAEIAARILAAVPAAPSPAPTAPPAP